MQTKLSPEVYRLAVSEYKKGKRGLQSIAKELGIGVWLLQYRLLKGRKKKHDIAQAIWNGKNVERKKEIDRLWYRKNAPKVRAYMKIKWKKWYYGMSLSERAKHNRAVYLKKKLNKIK